jgi:hypothetical protein
MRTAACPEPSLAQGRAAQNSLGERHSVAQGRALARTLVSRRPDTPVVRKHHAQGVGSPQFGGVDGGRDAKEV